MPLPVSIFAFLGQNLGWFLLGAVLIALVGALSLASGEARERRISSRIFVVAIVVAAAPLAAYAIGLVALSLMSSPSA